MKLLTQIFHVKGIILDESRLPIGDYQIIREIPAMPYESVTGDNNFIGMNCEKGMNIYAYIRPFDNQDENIRVFSERDILTQSFFKNMRGSDHIIRGTEIRTEPNAEVRYIAYDIQENTRTLDEIYKELKPFEILDIIEQVASGLACLSSLEIDIHHRCIRPTNIFVTKFADGYDARIGCFETAKIVYSKELQETVSEEVARKTYKSIFTFQQLTTLDEVSEERWEKGDVYSLCVILISCFDNSIISKGILKQNILDRVPGRPFTDGFFAKIDDILFSDSFDRILRMSEFAQLLSKELKHGNN